MMILLLRWIRLFFSFCFFCFCIFCTYHLDTTLYLIRQAKGQLSVLTGTNSFEKYVTQNTLTLNEKNNLNLIEVIKKYSVDSLGYAPTENFTTIYNQHHSAVLWVITACEPYSFKTYNWVFPIVGKVSYKGFFDTISAKKEYRHLKSRGYDVDLRTASAWSTLGWFRDPLLSNMLRRNKGSFCNLLFHELFHATYYAPGSVDLNENLANFVAHKATLQFLKNDSASLNVYLRNFKDNQIYNNYMLRKRTSLEKLYRTIKNNPKKQELKLLALLKITDSITLLPLSDKKRYLARKTEILKFKNAYFVDFQQYESMQDSLELVFNKIYTGRIENMVRDLTTNKINY